MTAFGLLAGFILTQALPLPAQAQEKSGTLCPPVGVWSDPATGNLVSNTELVRLMSKKPIVLLGEAHTSAEHHRWQLQVISALHGQNPNMIIGFEAFPRTVQPVLDQWSRGDLSEQKFLEMSRWSDVWRFDPGLYMPLFHFARMNRIPMRALNVERSLPRRAGAEGWAAIPVDERRGVGDPAAPSAAYLKSLKEVFGEHADAKKDGKDELDEIAFGRFVDAQLVWDRAMAEALAKARNAGGKPLVIGIIGRGHLEYGYGVPHQLNDLGVKGTAVLLPSDSGPPCVTQKPADDQAGTVADALFGISAPVEPVGPRRQLLGVQIDNYEGEEKKAVRIIKVVKDSIAQTTGLLDGDLIIGAAGLDIAGTRDLITVIQRQAPGTWLPLVILRSGQQIDLIARFPAHP